MNLLQVIQAIEKTAADQPAVNSIVRNDVYRLNACPSVKYGVFAWLQNEHTSSEESSLLSFNFTFFYVDRLQEDKRNEVEIQSQGIEALENILRRLSDLGIFPGSYSFRTFNERFSDECAGVFCTVTLDVVKDTLCAEYYGIMQGYAPKYDEDAHVWIWKDKQII